MNATQRRASNNGIPKDHLSVVKEFEESFRASFRGDNIRDAMLEIDDPDDPVLKRQSYMQSSINGSAPLSRIASANDIGMNGEAAAAAHQDTITAKESKSVNALKTVMYLTLIFSALTIGLATFWFLQDERLRLLELEVEAIAGEAASEMEAYLNEISSQLHQLGMSFSSEYQSVSAMNGTFSSSWVDLTLPHFDQRIKNDPKSDLIFYAPIIPSGGSDDVLLNEWTNYSIQNQNWIDDALDERGWEAITTEIPEQIYSFSTNATTTTTTESSNMDNILDQNVVTPIWQVSPVPRDRSIINLNAMSVPALSDLWHTSSSSSENDSTKARLSATLDAAFFERFVQEEQENTAPESFLSTPVFKTFSNEDTTPFGYLFGLVSWKTAVSMAFQDSHVDLSIALSESCGNNETMTFWVHANEKAVIYQEPNAAPLKIIDPNFKEEYDIPHDGCNYHMVVHALDGAEKAITREIPWLGFFIAGLLLVFLAAIFYWYNKKVKRRQIKLLATAKRSNAVVSSLFPEAVQNRLMQEVVENEQNITGEGRKQFLKKTASKRTLGGPESKEDEGSETFVRARGKAIADFFPETTIMFADIVGFTAWSSMREPTQVFELLESIYSCFDDIARKRRVFKVETIGDCYVAVVGLPDPCEEHAIVMARFAHDCRMKMNETVRNLEVTLGPDTADLSMRIGLHSGPVTAGVLRGDKARFQLFGDTMNTTSRIETTGKANRIHISEQTAQYLMAAGKKHWLALREDKVTAKGKGELTTYWLRIGRAARGRRNSLASQASSRSMGDESVGVEPQSPKKAENKDDLSEKKMRLVDWITNELERFLARVESKRSVVHAYPDSPDVLSELEQQSLRNLTAKMPLDEYADVIDFPKFDADLADFLMLTKRETVDETIKLELRDYVKSVASMYKDNPFHNFEHASHVTMSVAKLISRIVTPGNEIDVNDNAMKLHESTYGIASDPLTQFAMALSSLIHDADHPGVPNTRLIKDNDPLSGRYKKKSMAEQNSLDKCWRLLMGSKYANLRSKIYQTKSEYQRFRQVVVNTVIATDIMDKSLLEKQKERWDMAFTEGQEGDPSSLMNRKATIVIEHVIQASDIAHTMQHWHVYRKWNGRLFEEMYKAFTTKRGEFNPADKWYKGELDFFDFYIIPLAQKLKDCKVFGVSGDELLNYAQQNRQEWSLDGKKVVQTMVKAMRLEGEGPIRGVSRYASSDSQSLGGSLHGGTYRGSGGSVRKVPRTPARQRKPVARGSRSPIRRTSADSSKAPSMNSKQRDMLLQTMNVAGSLDGNSFDLEVNEEFESFETLSHHSELTQDSYARKGKDLKLPEELNVLVIDDDNLNRRLFTRAIMSLAPKWIMSEAESVEEALDVIEKSATNFDVIFMDHYAGSIVGDFLGSSAVKLLRIKGVNSLICAMSERDKEVIFDSMEGDVFGESESTLLFEPKALLTEVRQIMYQSGDFDW